MKISGLPPPTLVPFSPSPSPGSLFFLCPPPHSHLESVAALVLMFKNLEIPPPHPPTRAEHGILLAQSVSVREMAHLTLVASLHVAAGFWWIGVSGATWTWIMFLDYPLSRSGTWRFLHPQTQKCLAHRWCPVKAQYHPGLRLPLRLHFPSGHQHTAAMEWSINLRYCRRHTWPDTG